MNERTCTKCGWSGMVEACQKCGGAMKETETPTTVAPPKPSKKLFTSSKK